MFNKGMSFEKNILYFDITNICNLDCKFCIYRNSRNKIKNLRLNKTGKKNLSSFFKDRRLKRIIISGEGEPFLNFQVLKEIISLAKGKEIYIYSSCTNPNLKKELDIIGKIAKGNRDKITIRLSVDSFHYEKIGFERYKGIFETILNNKIIHFSIRSLANEKDGTYKIINNILQGINKKDYRIIKRSFKGKIFLKNKTIDIKFKNQFKTKNKKDYLKMIRDIEKNTNQKLTMGFLFNGGKGLDILIKPNGAIYFWGLDKKYGNILKEKINLDKLINLVKKNKLLTNLHTIPFEEILKFVKYKFKISKEISELNDPHWIMKKIYSKYSNLIERM